MNKETQKEKDLEERVQEVLAFANEKEVFIGACQQISKEGRIETVPLYKDLKQYVKDVEFSEATGTPFPEELK